MQQLLEFIGQFDSGFGSTIEGASAVEIGTLSRLAGLALPESYRSFLPAMGHSTGKLSIALDCTMDIRDLIEIYEHEIGELDVPDSGLLIAASGTAIPELFLRSHNGIDEGVVYWNGDGILRNMSS